MVCVALGHVKSGIAGVFSHIEMRFIRNMILLPFFDIFFSSRGALYYIVISVVSARQTFLTPANVSFLIL